MPVIVQNSVLRDVSVKDVMRAQVIHLPASSSIEQAIRFLIKFKVNALLVTDEEDLPLGVASKTDVMGAYYAGLPLESPLEHIMVAPPLFCGVDDSLESALELMKSNRVYRLYVSRDDREGPVGVLAYPDIVGLLYRYCRTCDKSLFRRKMSRSQSAELPRITVKEVMTSSVTSFSESATLSEIMEGLSEYRFGAVLIRDESDAPVGVVSKTDLVLAYKHHVDSLTAAKTVFSWSGVYSCDGEDFVEEAIRRMIVSDVHRLFVYSGDTSNIVGVFSLSDAARVRSGSCHACVSSRIRVEDGEQG